MGMAGDVHGFRMQLQAQRRHDFQDCVEAGTSFPGECFVEAFTRQTGVARNLCHPLGPGDISQSFRDKSRIAVSLLKASFKIRRPLFRGS